MCKMDVEKVKTLVKQVDNELFEIINHLICSVCQELFNNPVTTPCGHCFCNGCIKRVLSSKNNIGCPLCKCPVKRYSLKAVKVKSTLSIICQELPSAFKRDVEDMGSEINEFAQDFIKRSKLFQLNSHDSLLESKATKRKSSRIEERPKDSDVDSFIPVVKRSKNVVEYSNPKKNRVDDLVSISQTELGFTNSTTFGPSDIERKLEKIKKIPAEEKVKEWFEAVGDNIFLNSPSTSLVEMEQRQDGERENQVTTRVRIDYMKQSDDSKENEKRSDPYEFIPSQNNKRTLKRKSKPGARKIPQFKTLQMFTKESLKRTLINQEQEKEQDTGDDYIDSPKSHKIMTASQKFDNLLKEAKENEKKDTVKVHTLYSSSQASSVKFLDCSFNSKTEKETNIKKCTPGLSKRKLFVPNKEENFKNSVLFSSNFSEKEKESRRSKRKRSIDIILKEKKKKKLGDDESIGSRATKLMDLLEELLNDEVIYSRTKTSPIKLERISKFESQDKNLNNVNQFLSNDCDGHPSQGTLLIGFGTQKEPQDIKNFKEMVANMEEELESEEIQLSTDFASAISKVHLKTKFTEMNSHENQVCQSLEENTLKTVVPFNLMGKIKKNKNSFIEFVQLGRLTPTKRRSRSSVVKLVFPIGLSSFARRRSAADSILKRASPTVASTPAQTFHIFKPRTAIANTSQENRSVEIQTSQNFTSEIHVQSSQTENRFKSAEIQTSQVPYNFAEVQTTQIYKNTLGAQTSQFLQTPAVCREYPETSKNICLSSKEIQNELYSVKEKSVIAFEGKEIPAEENCVTDLSLKEFINKSPYNSFTKSNEKQQKAFQINSGNLLTVKSSLEFSDFCLSTHVDGSKTPEGNLLGNVDADCDAEKKFAKSWTKSPQKLYENFVQSKNKKNITCSIKNLDQYSEDSDARTMKQAKIAHILPRDSQSFTEIHPNTYADKKKVFDEDHEIIIDLRSPKENSQDQLLKVLKNIEMDLKGKKGFENTKSEESDSDFFVEQTPPRPRSSNTRWKDNSRTVSTQDQLNSNKKGPVILEENGTKNDADSADLIENSFPKVFPESESVLMLSTPEKIVATPKKTQKKLESSISIENFLKPPDSLGTPKSNENDQNQLNANLSNKKEMEIQVKAPRSPFVRRTDPNQKKACSQRNKICIVASSVKNPELVKRFVNKFKLDYSNKFTKDMTHLIVGLHPNEEGELLPLCTPKLLFAMANKKWVVSESWTDSCLKTNTLVPEESFETPDPVGGDGCRSARLSANSLLEKCEVCLVGEFQTITKEDFASLIVDCGGVLIDEPDKFSFASSKIRMMVADRDCLSMDEKELQDLFEKYSTVILSRDVIIMSIQSFKLCNFTPYLLHLASEEDLVEKGYPPVLVRSEDDEGEAMTATK